MRSLMAAIATALFLTACIPIPIDLTCDLSGTTVNGSSNQVSIKVYIDGTPSMQGFVSDPNGRYAQTLEKLLSVLKVEPIGLDGKPRSFSRAAQFFRLGRLDDGKEVQVISREEYRQAELTDFYTGTAPRFPLLEVSQIDAAIDPPSEGLNELTIIVTDLYQAQEDATKIVDNIKKYLSATNQNGAVGVLGVRSQFNGRVYTEALAGVGQFSYTSRGEPLRPFYILFIGQLDEVHFYLNKLQNDLIFNQGTEAVIFSPYRMYDKIASLDRKFQQDLYKEISPEQRKQITVPGVSLKHGRLVVNLKDQHVQPLILRSKEAIALPFQVNLASISHIMTASELTTQVTPKSFNPQLFNGKGGFEPDTKHPSLQQVLSLKQLSPKESTLSFTAQIQPESIKPDGIYVFEVEARVNTSGEPLSEQSWWNDWNSLPTSTDGTKTHDLESFLSDLRNMTIGLMRQKPLIIGRFCYVIQKG
jgi:hypothetical protein